MATSPNELSFSARSSFLFCKDMERDDADVTTCFGCGDRYRRGHSKCSCDRLSAFLDDLIQVENRESRMPLLQHFIQEWAGAE
jgi:hypothetical protein